MLSKLSFTASSQAMELTEDVNLYTSRILKPAVRVNATCELVGSPYIMSGDERGFLSAWDVCMIGPAISDRDPDHLFEAHPSASILTTNIFRSNRMAECLQAKLEAVNADLKAEEEKERPVKRGMLQQCCDCLSGAFHMKGGKEGFSRNNTTTHWYVVSGGSDCAFRCFRWTLDASKLRNLAVESMVHPVTGIPMVFEVELISEWMTDNNLPPVAACEVHDGLLAVATQKCMDVRLVDMSSSTVSVLLYGHTGPVRCLAWCHDGRLATGSEDGAVRLWKKSGWLTEPDEPPLAQREANHECGVCSMAYFAHVEHAQKAKGESVNVRLRVFIDRAENMPMADLFTESDPTVTVTVVEGEPAVVQDKTPAKANAEWNANLKVGLPEVLVDSRWQLPECLWLDFEVWAVSWIPMYSDTLLGHFSIPVVDVLKEIAAQKGMQARPIRAPHGKGPYKDLAEAVMYVEFGKANDGRLECRVMSGAGLPLGSSQKSYVTVSVQTLKSGRVRQIPSKRIQRTKTVDNCAHPWFKEVLELEVPASLVDRRAVFSPDLFLQFDVYDADLISDDHIAQLILPVHQALQVEGMGTFAFDMEAAPGVQLQKVQQEKHSRLPGALSPSSKNVERLLPKIHLAFQSILPCPNQLVCVIEQALKLPAMCGGGGGARAKLRIVEGNPMMAKLSACQTSVCSRTVNPHWGERCVLPIPSWLGMTKEAVVVYDAGEQRVVGDWWEVGGKDGRPCYVHSCDENLTVRWHEHLLEWRMSYLSESTALTLYRNYMECDSFPTEGWETDKASDPPPVNIGKAIRANVQAKQVRTAGIRKPSVRAGWEHGGIKPEAHICVDVYHKSRYQTDPRLAYATIPLSVAADRAKAGPDARWEEGLSCSPDAFLLLGFELEADQLTVLVHEARNLPGQDMLGNAEPYCVVRIAEVGAFGEPTDYDDFTTYATQETDAVTHPQPRNPSWQKLGMLELPGGELECVVLSNCGEVRADGDWRPHGDRNGRPLYVHDMDNDSIIYWEPQMEEWRLAIEGYKGGRPLFRSQEATDTIPTTGWEILEGTAPPPSIKTRGTRVAVRPNMHLLVEVVEFDTVSKKDELMAYASLPLTDVLGELAEHDMMGSTTQTAWGTADKAPGTAGSLRAAARTPPPPTLTLGGTLGGGKTRNVITHQLVLLPGSSGNARRTDKGASAALSDMMSSSLAFATRTMRSLSGSASLGSRLKNASSTANESDADPLAVNEGGMIELRFEIASRWDGRGRDPKSKRPMAQAVTKASPVTCLCTLVSSVVAGYESGNIFVWDVTGCSPLPLHHFRAHTVPINSLTYVPALDCLVTTGIGDTTESAVDSQLKVWTTSTLELRQSISLSSFKVRCAQPLLLKGAKDAPSVAICCDTRSSKQVQLLRVGRAGDEIVA
eukprot:TRINITY_DN18982_c0_g1_i1.p1 TRINITY_DN18982_c0_g1~~TRINITY_DN18982_c0_g1_i1.p1  ORF type:complete len:1403 (+),score=301.55 TRINITY_DN18982_c0_g1_i1:146-4354(+)